MSLTKEQRVQISDFSDRLDFIHKGGLMTDLDGTVIQEQEGRYFMPEKVQQGLMDMYNTTCPIVINTMRFPMSVIKTFANDWYDISKASVPLVSLNGSQIGYINKETKSKFTFEEIDAFPLKKAEINHFISDIENILSNAGRIVVFYYPRDWKKGEIIWIPEKDRLAEAKERYKSASKVYTSDLQTLKDNLAEEDICMIFLKVSQDAGTSFDHTNFKDFYSSNKVDKLFGAKKIISHLDREMSNFIGAGDTPMDVFLKEIGQAIKVGNMDFHFEFNSNVLRLEQVSDIGEVFTEVAKTCVAS